MAARPTETVDESGHSRAGEDDDSVPGVIVVFSKGEPLQAPVRLEQGSVTLGRRSMPGVQLSDHRMSRSHVRVSKTSSGFRVEDLESRNGSSLNGQRLEGALDVTGLAVVRAGDTLFVLRDDVRPFEQHALDLGEPWVLGPKMRSVLDAIRRSAAFGSLHITGETGTGKELAARSFHTFGPSPSGPFVAVNCATIPEGVADRLLFGAKKGAFSGASADVGGYVQEADGGTLFLDEVGELDLNVQAKLLRFLETREVLPVGETRARRVDVRVCSATHRDLRRAARAGKFREDLLYRVARPHVALPPLRDRIEDIPHLIDRKLRSINSRLIAHVSLVEACLLRSWPGNVRELATEIQDAASLALDGGFVVRGSHLSPSAGTAALESVPPATGSSSSEAPVREADLDRDSVVAALKRSEGKVATAARELGVHRNQLRRWLEKNGLDPKEPG